MGNLISHTVAFKYDVNNRKAANLYVLASIFQIDANNLQDRQSAPQLFLYVQAIELFLKSYLLCQGKTERELFKIGHDSEMLLAVSVANGLNVLDDTDKKILTELADANLHVNLRYEIDFEVNFLPEDLRRIVSVLNNTVGPLATA